MNMPPKQQMDAMGRLAERAPDDFRLLLELVAFRADLHRKEATAPGLLHRDEACGRAQAYAEMQHFVAAAFDMAQAGKSLGSSPALSEPQPWEGF